MRDNPEGEELDPAVDDRKSCKKYSPSISSCMDKSTKEGCNRGAKSGKVTECEAGKDQFLSGNRGNLTRENCEKDFVSMYLYYDREDTH